MWLALPRWFVIACLQRIAHSFRLAWKRRGVAHAVPPRDMMVVCQRTMRYQLLYTLAFLAILRIMEVFRNILYFRF